MIILAAEPRDFDQAPEPGYYEGPAGPSDAALPRESEDWHQKSTSQRAAVPREDSERSHYSSRDYWKRMDDMFDRTIAIAENSYRTNRMINIIVVIIGIVLIANSIVYTWYKQSPDAWSLFSGGLGLVSFVTIFLTKPQLRITKALANLVQIQMIYKSHSLQYEAVSDYHWEKYKNGNRDIAELTQMNKELDRATENAAKLVESYVEKDREGVFR
jgi:hypothetical protein